MRRWADRMRRGIPGTVIALGFVSLFTDLASEMIYPLVPVFLTDVLGASALALGVVEGVAESTASIVKIVSGWWTDRVRRRKPFVLAGYGIAGAVRPLMAVASSWFAVVSIRFVDRIGKGLRTSPRDALIADVTDPEHRGAAFGLHRGFDHFGSVLGPLVAALLLGLGLGLRGIFLLTAIPGALVVLLVVRFVREPSPTTATDGDESTQGAGPLGGAFWRLLGAVLIFTLGNSADAFFLLRFTELGISLIGVTLLWAAFSLVKTMATVVGGRMADRRTRRSMVLSGWTVYAAVYLAMAFSTSATAAVVLFLGYGIHFGFTEPAERAWVADVAPETARGRAFGYYNAAVGIGALPANLLFGALWVGFGAAVAFGTGAALAAVAMLVLLIPLRSASPR